MEFDELQAILHARLEPQYTLIGDVNHVLDLYLPPIPIINPLVDTQVSDGLQHEEEKTPSLPCSSNDNQILDPCVEHLVSNICLSKDSKEDYFSCSTKEDPEYLRENIEQETLKVDDSCLLWCDNSHQIKSISDYIATSTTVLVMVSTRRIWMVAWLLQNLGQVFFKRGSMM